MQAKYTYICNKYNNVAHNTALVMAVHELPHDITRTVLLILKHLRTNTIWCEFMESSAYMDVLCTTPMTTIVSTQHIGNFHIFQNRFGKLCMRASMRKGSNFYSSKIFTYVYTIYELLDEITNRINYIDSDDRIILH